MKKMVKIKHDKQYNEAIERAESDFRSPSCKEVKDLCPYIFSSNMADAYFIAANCLYYNGRRPRSLWKSRGHSWLVDYPGIGIVRVTVDKPDHRDGIVISEP